MQLSELVPIGKLGNSIDSEGFIKLRKTKDFKESYLKLTDIFLVFKDNRVRLVTLMDVSKSRGHKLKFKETDIVRDGISTGSVKVMLAGEDIDEIENPEEDWIGMEVFFSGKGLSTILILLCQVGQIMICIFIMALETCMVSLLFCLRAQRLQLGDMRMFLILRAFLEIIILL